MKLTPSSNDTLKGPADWFTGDVYIDMIPGPSAPSRLGAAVVHFTPGARTVWHTHPVGQTIFVTEGVGRCQREGGPVETIRPGDSVFFEPGENHWHGAAPTRFMVHTAMQEADESGSNVTWASTSATSSTSPRPRRFDHGAALLGRTGVSVSKLCLGAMMLGVWGNPEHDESIRIIHAALDAGINFIDTADVYSGASRRRSSARHSPAAGATTSSWPPSFTSRWTMTPTIREGRGGGSSLRCDRLLPEGSRPRPAISPSELSDCSRYLALERDLSRKHG